MAVVIAHAVLRNIAVTSGYQLSQKLSLKEVWRGSERSQEPLGVLTSVAAVCSPILRIQDVEEREL